MLDTKIIVIIWKFADLKLFDWNKRPFGTQRESQHGFGESYHIISYYTRQASNIHLTNPRTVLADKSIRHRGPAVWNALPQSLLELKKIQTYRKAIKNFLISHIWNVIFLAIVTIVKYTNLFLPVLIPQSMSMLLKPFFLYMSAAWIC